MLRLLLTFSALSSSQESLSHTVLSPAILIVEDDKVTCQTLVTLLRLSLPYEIIGCDSVQSALEHFQQRQILLLLTDYGLPDSDGVTLAKTVVQRWAGTPILLITGNTDPNISAAAQIAGVIACLYKPVSPTGLLRAVKAALGVE